MFVLQYNKKIIPLESWEKTKAKKYYLANKEKTTKKIARVLQKSF